MFLAHLDNDDELEGLIWANINIMQVSMALNQGMISFYHLVHSRGGQDTESDKNVC